MSYKDMYTRFNAIYGEVDEDYFLFHIFFCMDSGSWKWIGNELVDHYGNSKTYFQDYINFIAPNSKTDLVFYPQSSISNIPEEVEDEFIRKIYNFLIKHFDVTKSINVTQQALYIRILLSVQERIIGKYDDIFILWYPELKPVKSLEISSLVRTNCYIVNDPYSVAMFYWKKKLNLTKNKKKYLFVYNGETVDLSDLLEFTEQKPELIKLMAEIKYCENLVRPSYDYRVTAIEKEYTFFPDGINWSEIR